MVEADIAMLRAAGLGDAEIFEVNQIVAHFTYWTRMRVDLRPAGAKIDGSIPCGFDCRVRGLFGGPCLFE